MTAILTKKYTTARKIFLSSKPWNHISEATAFKKHSDFLPF